MAVTEKLPLVEDIYLYQGDDFDFFFRLRDDEVNEDGFVTSSSYRDLTGFVGAAQIRSLKLDTLLATFSVFIPDQAVSPGAVLLSLTSAQTSALGVSTDAATGKWDVQLTDTSGKITTYIGGSVYVQKQVTR